MGIVSGLADLLGAHVPMLSGAKIFGFKCGVLV